MKSVRISIEWNYGTTASLFTLIAMKGKFKMYETAGVARIYIVATLLKNFHACLYGNQTMNYFNVVLQEDFLECYISGSVLVSSLMTSSVLISVSYTHLTLPTIYSV